MNEQILFDFLKDNHIAYKLFKHQPVFTTEETQELIDSDVDTIPGMDSKNLFLKDKKSGTFYLVSVTQDKRVDLKALSDVLNCGRFSFGKPEELLELLKLTPGSVTPFGLLFDQQNKVTFVLDEDFVAAPSVNFHPMRNDMTINMDTQSFLLCMKKMGHAPRVVRIPVQR
jgi:Ala-tRNA(Pro) deacylase